MPPELNSSTIIPRTASSLSSQTTGTTGKVL